ncbi:sigma-70 family RNA polymerase sigma factor [Endozoicomonas sp. SM1973]|uniref:RNA polymerase sigma factor n=1 Tax=Spartinivicinus marinus TaxID=2994442 RepID=A0A853I9D0_9GAMM|nr:sigma-70 family RNA polymerase sigma factor [Spartinivicinus marinus]MCX4026387.1 sigma-70 family RNA polymerase sigma factor [Spartinivicinus marinus]NYZ67268.1 sigma-70 family RNA polymerase sigma factor [Spartinivicinus marinus]
MVSEQRRFTELVATYQKSLYQYAYWLTHDQPTAEDLVQDTFMKAWRGFAGLKKIESAKAWLITILRRENARRFQQKTIDYSEVDVEDMADYSGRYHYSENLDSLRYCIQQLPDMYREPLLMQVILGFSQEEIAEELNIPSNTVATRLRRARFQLKTITQENEILVNRQNKVKVKG